MAEVCDRKRVRFWHVPDLENLELQFASGITGSTARQLHDGFSIQLVEEGTEGFAYRGATYRAPVGTISVIHPGEVHTSFAAGEGASTFRLLYPSADLLRQVAGELSGAEASLPYFEEPVIWSPALFRRFRQLHISFEQPGLCLEREALLLGCLAQLVIQHARLRFLEPSSVSRCSRLIDEVRGYIELNYPQDISLAQLGRLVHMSPFHLARVFRAQVGLPPHAYLIQVRIARARVLLAHGFAIAEVAAQTGFVDQSHLYKYFKQSVGVTPGQYVQSARKPSGRALGGEHLRDVRSVGRAAGVVRRGGVGG